MIRTFGTDFNEILVEGGIAGSGVALHKDFKAVADGIVVKVYDNENIMLWQQPRNYALNLKNAKIYLEIFYFKPTLLIPTSLLV